MRSFRGLPLLSTTVLIATACYAHAESLNDAVQSALTNHPAVEAAREGVSAAHQDENSEYSGYFPELSVSATGGRLYGDNATSRGLSVSRGAGYSHLWEGSVSANQMIFDGFETKNRVESARARIKSAAMELSDVEEALALRAVQSYLNVARAAKGLEMLRSYNGKVGGYLDRIQSAVKEGAADESEYQQARDVRALLEGFVADYEGQLSMAQADYLEVTGHLPEGKMETPPPATGFTFSEMEDAVAFAKASHPALQAASFTAKSAGYDEKSEKAQIYPDVTGELSHLKSDKRDIIGGEVVDSRAVVHVNWALETGGGQIARIKKKTYERREALARMGEAERRIERGVRISYAELNTAENLLTNQKKRIDLNRKLFETYQAQFEGARITLIQLMQAHNQLFNAELEKMNGEYRVVAAQYGILAALGQLAQSVKDTDQDTENSETSSAETPAQNTSAETIIGFYAEPQNPPPAPPVLPAASTEPAEPEAGPQMTKPEALQETAPQDPPKQPGEKTYIPPSWRH